MILRIRIGRWRFTFTFAPVTNVIGVNSNLPDGDHILMWDFDNIKLCWVKTILNMVQQKYKLSKIYILNTGKPNHYIAYCFKRCIWRYAVEIIASTPGVCWDFFKYGVYRGHFTLRVTPKEGRWPTLATILESNTPEDVKVKQLKSWTQYETLSDQAKMKKVELNIATSRYR